MNTEQKAPLSRPLQNTVALWAIALVGCQSGSVGPADSAVNETSKKEAGAPANDASYGNPSLAPQGAGGGKAIGGQGGATGKGGASTGGSAGTIATMPGDAGHDQIPPHQVLPCDKLSTIGQWENISPPGVKFTQDFVLDPNNAGTVFVGGGQGFGIWKSTDCGSTWTHVNTGMNATSIDQGGHWTIVIDQTDSNVLYTGNGYGDMGVFKTMDGGKNWTQIVPPDVLKSFVNGGFVERITIDPTNHKHILVSPHFTCQNAHSTHCFWESMDAGATWNVLENQPAVTEDTGQFMIDTKLWFFAAFDGLWRTQDGGANWTKVHGGATDSFYEHSDTLWYGISLTEGVLKSTDMGLTWAAIPNSPHSRALVGDGRHIFASNRNSAQQPYKPYQFAPEENPTTWATYDSPLLPNGGWVVYYDNSHGVLYSSSEGNGFWRVKTK